MFQVENQEVKDLSKAEPNHTEEGAIEIPSKNFVNTENDDINKNPSPDKNPEIIKLCKLKERRLQEFYREQRQSELGLTTIPLGGGGLPYKAEELLSPGINIAQQNINNINTCIKNESKIITPLVNKFIKVDNDWNYEKQDAKSVLVNDNKILLKSNTEIKNNSLIPGPSLQTPPQDSNTVNDSNNNYRLPEDKPSSNVLKNSTSLGCNDCSFECVNKQELTEHVKEHVKALTSPFVCNICQKTFSHKGQLATHQKLQHEAKNPEHSCSHCGKVFLTKASLKVS